MIVDVQIDHLHVSALLRHEYCIAELVILPVNISRDFDVSQRTRHNQGSIASVDMILVLYSAVRWNVLVPRNNANLNLFI